MFFISKCNYAYTIKIIFFSNEETHLGGSRHYAWEAKLRSDDILSVLNFDVIGTWIQSTPRDLNIIYKPNSEWLADGILTLAATYTDHLVNKNLQFFGISDHDTFLGNNFFAVQFFEAGDRAELNPYINTFNDLLHYIDKSFLTDNIKVGVAAASYFASPLIKQNLN